MGRSRHPRSLCLVPLVLISTCAAFRLQPRGIAAAGPGPAPSVVTLTAVGDIIIHAPVFAAAWDGQNATYDFRPMFEEIKPLLTQADLATAVLETTLAGPAGGYSGYPTFNSPDQIAEALPWAGVDVVFTAHNHVLDRGIDGIFRTLRVLDRLGLPHVGTAGDPDPAARTVLKEVNGVRLAFLAYTTATNGIPVPDGKEWAVNIYRPELAAADIRRARQSGAEVVVCALHSGVEYQRRPAPEQEAIVDRMIQAGADIILGSHPHVIEPVEIRRVPAGDSYRTVFIAYSLGNLLSNQRWQYSDCGLMVTLTIAKTRNAGTRLVKAVWMPVWVHKYAQEGRSKYRILPVCSDAAVYQNDPLLTAADRRRLAQVWEETAALCGPSQILPVAGGSVPKVE